MPVNRESGPDSDRQNMVEQVRACIASMDTPSDDRSMFGVVRPPSWQATPQSVSAPEANS